MPELAYIGQVTAIYPIPGADFIESLEVGESFNLSDDEALRRYAERTYPNGATAEGVVIRPTQEMQVDGERLSFKVINLLYRD